MVALSKAMPRRSFTDWPTAGTNAFSDTGASLSASDFGCSFQIASPMDRLEMTKNILQEYAKCESELATQQDAVLANGHPKRSQKMSLKWFQKLSLIHI